MNITVEIVELLLHKSVKKAGQTPDRIGLLETAGIINSSIPSNYRPIGSRYLYDTVFLRVQRARYQQAETVNLEQAMLDSLAAYLGFHGVDEFRSTQQPLIPPEARAIEGNWYSIVRCNSGKERVLVSPVKIEVRNSATFLELSGPHRTYQGKIRWTAGSFSCFLTSKDGIKVIHLAFRLGVAKRPSVLSGVFSGISSSGIPIAGKELLVRSAEDYTEMKNLRVNINQSDSIPNLITPEIAQYFSDFEKSYIKIDSASTFDADKLDQ